MKKDGLSIGDLSSRTGLSVSAIRYYEREGLIAPWRNPGGQRRFERADIRRLSFVMIAQQFGFTLPQIKVELDRLPRTRAPSKADWSRIGAGFRRELDRKIETMTRMRETLDGCIGCGCLSLDVCALYNARDKASQRGQGPRYLMGDHAADIVERRPRNSDQDS